MRQSNRQEELDKRRFSVDIDEVSVAGWKRIDLPRRSTQETEYRERTDGENQRTLWGRTEYDDLTMVRGARPGDTKLWDWRRSVEEGRAEEGRKSLTVSLQDEEGSMQMQWEFRQAWPKEYDPPDLDASAAPDAVATEGLTVAFDEMIRTK